MKPGKKTGPPSEKRARGTFRPDRHGALVQPEDRPDLPQEPTWLTAEGREAWLDLVSQVAQTKAACQLDSVLLGTLANLIGACAQCWAAKQVPPAAHLSELRRLSEVFGLAGIQSRVLTIGITLGHGAPNIFANNGRRRGADGA